MLELSSYGWMRERVHDRRRPARGAVGGAEVGDERGRRVRLACRVGPVAAARRDRPADHLDAGVGRLERVVRLREQALVGGRRGVAAVGGELRQPVAVEVRLVADDHVPDRGGGRDDRGGVGGEIGLVGVGERRRRAAVAEHAREHLDPVGGRGGGDVAEDRRVLGGDGRLAGRPDLRDPDGAEPGQLQQVHLRPRAGERRRADGVLGRAEHHRRPARVRRRRERECRGERDHDPAGRAPHALGYRSRGRGGGSQGAAGEPADEAGRLPVPRRGGRGALRRQGEVAAVARPLVLPEDDGRPRPDPAAARSASPTSR